MPRGVPIDILNQLSSTSFTLWYLVRVTLLSGVRYWCEGAANGVVFEGQTYSARLTDGSALQYTVGGSQQVSFKLSNVDNLITTIDRSESFLGAKVEIIEYFPDIAEGYVRWVGYSDELSEITTLDATIQAYAGYPSSSNTAPRRTIQTTCQWYFKGDNAAWQSTTNFERAECPYQRTGTIGFTTTLNGAVDGVTNPVILTVTQLPNGRFFRNGDVFQVDTETMLVLSGGSSNTLTCARSQRATLIAAHSNGAAVTWADCQKAYESCKDHGMAGNNSADHYTDSTNPNGSVVRNRNYYGGLPAVTGYVTNFHPLDRIGNVTASQFGSNQSAFGTPIYLTYGKCLFHATPVLIVDEGPNLAILCVIAEGVLATNPNDDSQTTPLNAYQPDPTDGQHPYIILINGAKRWAYRVIVTDPYLGIAAFNGTQDQRPPNISNATLFFVDQFGMNGTAYLQMRLNKANNGITDVNNTSIDVLLAVQYGRVVSQYSTPSSFVRKATTNPAWALLDIENSIRAGCLDISRIDVQSYIDAAAYSNALVTSTTDGTQVPRWTFNGILDTSRSMAEIESAVCLGMYALPPILGIDGTYKLKMLKAESLSGLPIFSSSANDRNIIWDENGSTLTKARNSLLTTPNEVRVDFLAYEKYSTVLNGAMDGTSNPVIFHVYPLETPGRYIQTGDYIKIDGEELLITAGGSTTLHASRAQHGTTIAAHSDGTLVHWLTTTAFDNQAWLTTELVVSNDQAQKEVGTILGDGSARIISTTVSLIGTTTVDEAARIGTLILRAGQFAQGGLNNNLIIEFDASYRYSADVELGDIIQVQDDMLDPIAEAYFRVIDLQDQFAQQNGEGFQIVRHIKATLHDNAIYDDTAFTSYRVTRLDPPVAYDLNAPPVTGWTVVENGLFDGNNKPVTNLTFTYTQPDSTTNFKSVVVMACDDDGSGNPQGNWTFVTELLQSGTVFQFPITNTIIHFRALSKNIADITPDVNTVVDDGSGDLLYPTTGLLINGLTSVLPAPGSPQIQVGAVVSLSWAPYTGDNLKLFKTFHVYRNTVNTFGSATLLGTLDGTLFVDTLVSSSVTYYYWIAGYSILGVEGTPTSSLTTTAPAGTGSDSGVPDTPTIETFNNLGSYNTNEYQWIIGVAEPGGASNWNTVFATDLEIATDSGFTMPVAGFPRTLGAPPIDFVFSVNTPGIYYFRTRVQNTYGYSAYSSTLTRNTNFFDGLSADTGIPPVPTNLALLTQNSLAQLAGNQFQVNWQVPDTNTASYYGYAVYVNSTSTLPTATTAYSSFAHGGVTATLAPGSNVMQVAGSPGWSANQWAGKDIVVFAASRGGSPTFDYEGQMFVLGCTSSTASSITLDIASERMVWSLSGLGFYIVTPNAGNHFYEKLTFATPLEINQGAISLTQDRGSRLRSIVFNSSIATVYVWVSLYNLYGGGKVTASPPTATFPGLSTVEIGANAITIAKMANNSVGSSQIVTGAVISTKLTKAAQSFSSNLVFSATDYRTVAWTSGTVLTADGTSYSITASNSGSMSALTYIYLDPSVSSTVLQVTTTYSNVSSDTAILLCVGKNTADTTQNAFFIPAVGVFGINNTNIGPNSISTGSIQASAITTSTLAANAVTAAKISVSQLSAIAADLGSITAGTITGAILQTATSGQRVVIDSSNGFRAFNSGGTAQTQIWTSGLISTVSITGISGDLNLFCNSGNADVTITNSGAFSGFTSPEFGVYISGIGKFGVWGSGASLAVPLTTTSGITITGSASFRCATGQGVGTSTEAWAFPGNMLSGYTASVERVRVDTTSSPTKTPLWLYFNGTLTQVSIFNDGLGHNILYF
jgi:phage-related protein